ncbi:hypothetical protein AAU57_05610 [Nonlabens sp. YIK11]|uniref:hypothetical protein n=1 Tax=Nonlabens sp. YIK11 TaxID=1453349 RepID=UPI0006DD1996|nr:hypothetical protein [Nonlabens sp. YIK11]KQC32847.1 hypothetical protein AAU57_05610 [Nonlabens sp. YIK11]
MKVALASLFFLFIGWTSIAQEKLQLSEYDFPEKTIGVSERQYDFQNYNKSWKAGRTVNYKFNKGNLIYQRTAYGLGGGTDSYELSYNDKNQMVHRIHFRTGSKTDGKYEYDYVYTGTNPVTITEAATHSRSYAPKTVISYNAKGEKSQEDSYNGNDKLTARTSYFPDQTIQVVYDGDRLWQKRVTKLKKGKTEEYTVFDKNDQVISQETFKYKKGNLISKTTLKKDGSTNTRPYTYKMINGFEVARIEIYEGYDKKPRIEGFITEYILEDDQKIGVTTGKETATLDELLTDAKKQYGLKNFDE